MYSVLGDEFCLLDVAIIGAGPAGLTSALYAARAGFSVIVFEKNIYGGQVASTNEVENYPAVERISGAEFSMNIYNQVLKQGVKILLEEVKNVDLNENVKKLTTDFGEYEAKTVIIATGVKRRKLGCKGEEKFLGRGVSYCATCDGAFFKDKDVAVVGGGNTALEDALFLANICKSVTLLVRKDRVRGEKFLLESVKSRNNIKLKYNTIVNEIGGVGETVSFIKIVDKNLEKEKKIEVSAVFIAIGLEPDNSIFSDAIKLDDSGYVLADESCKTNVAGVFVAGDTRQKNLRQIVTAMSDGAIAANNVTQYLNSQI